MDWSTLGLLFVLDEYHLIGITLVSPGDRMALPPVRVHGQPLPGCPDHERAEKDLERQRQDALRARSQGTATAGRPQRLDEHQGVGEDDRGAGDDAGPGGTEGCPRMPPNPVVPSKLPPFCLLRACF